MPRLDILARLMGPTLVLALAGGSMAQMPAPQVPGAPAAPGPQGVHPAAKQIGNTASQPGEAPKKKIRLEQIRPATLDLGYGPPLAFRSEVVTLQNVTEGPVTLTGARGECACTNATILESVDDKKTLAPGETVDILVGVEFPKDMGMYTKNLFVYEDMQGEAASHVVPIYFEVGFPVRVNGGTRYAIVVERTGKLKLDSMEDKPFRVVSVHGADPAYVDFNPASDEPRTSYEVTYDWSGLSVEKTPRWLAIETDHPGAEIVPIPAFISGVPRIIDKLAWRPVDETLNLGVVPSNRTLKASILFTGKAVLPGQRITAECDSTDLTLRIVNARKPDNSGGMMVDVEIMPRGGFQGFVNAKLTFNYDGAKTGIDLFARFKDGAPPKDFVR